MAAGPLDDQDLLALKGAIRDQIRALAVASRTPAPTYTSGATKVDFPDYLKRLREEINQNVILYNQLSGDAFTAQQAFSECGFGAWYGLYWGC